MEIDDTIRNMTGIISLITKVIYFITAVILSVLALVSFVVAAYAFLALLGPGDLTTSLLSILHAILLTIIIVEILETITAYFKTSKVLVRPILVAGLTAMVRRVLVLGVETINPTDILVTVAVIAVLTAAVVLVGKEELQEEKPC
ncbi:MAG TPA: phosphate-starvation-inducible PsiE family protein [Methanomicrobiales archaeon]|nr:phosphate-starvation-inducible PsiE family protein [Methanomicrobiales archaeon]